MQATWQKADRTHAHDWLKGNWKKSHGKNKKQNKTDDVIIDKKYTVKVLKPVNTITQRHESHEQRNSKGISIKTLKASRASSDWTKMQYYGVKNYVKKEKEKKKHNNPKKSE